MNEIDLRRFDLNLLVVFDVLMTERSVTRAAERLGRTQSAVSHSLSRLREQFGDPLLIKGGARMQPTALALALIEQARPMLGGIARVLSPQHIFDPTTSSRIFRLAAPDFMLTLFADLLTRLRAEAQSVSVEWTAPREPTLLDVAEGLIDVAIVPAELRWPSGVTGEAVGALGWRCFGRKGHAAFRDWGPAARAR
jgi:LysR family transcriptional regulator, mexEF-oprN operon transcriptional activator